MKPETKKEIQKTNAYAEIAQEYDQALSDSQLWQELYNDDV